MAELKAGKKAAKKEAVEKKAKPETAKGSEKKKSLKVYARKVRPKKSKGIKKAALRISKKKRKKFHGRFGKNSIRRKSIPKWGKWRYPRGADLEKTKQYICMPSSGFRSRKDTRGKHPSGYSERIVRNEREIEMLARKKETVAARIAGTTGGRKRAGIIKKANELGVTVLN